MFRNYLGYLMYLNCRLFQKYQCFLMTHWYQMFPNYLGYLMYLNFR